MRAVYEPKIENLHPKITRDYWRIGKKNAHTWVDMTCTRENCGAVVSQKVSYVKFLQQSGAKFVCRSCRDEGAKEMQQAMIALAKRKGLI